MGQRGEEIMNSSEFGFYKRGPDILPAGDRPTHGIAVDRFLSVYGINSSEKSGLVEILYKYPVLCLLLGEIGEQAIGTTHLPDGPEVSVYPLRRGAGIFSLSRPDDIWRYRGLLRHICVTARNAEAIASKLATLTETQKDIFASQGFNPHSFAAVDPTVLRDFTLVSHAGVRAAEEYRIWGLRDAVHWTADGALATAVHLYESAAPRRLLELMGAELLHTHTHMGSIRKNGISRIDWAIVSYADWRDRGVSLAERFAGLRQRHRSEKDPDYLDILEACGLKFEAVLQAALGVVEVERVVHAPMPDWEKDVREAFVASAGLKLTEVFAD